MIIFNFSVLARPAETLSLRQPDPLGFSLWRVFHETSIGRVCLVVNEEYEKLQLEDWLKKENIKPSFYEVLDEPDPVIRAERIHRVAAVFGKAEWYIDNDPITCAETLKLGMPTLVAASPYVVRPEWSGLRIVKDWDTLVKEMEDQALKAAEKSWRE